MHFKTFMHPHICSFLARVCEAEALPSCYLFNFFAGVSSSRGLHPNQVQSIVNFAGAIF